MPALLAAGALVSTALSAASAATPPPRPDARSTTVVFALRPSDPAAIARLRTDRRADAALRAATLRSAAPTAASRALVVRWLTAHGLTVTDTSPWAVTATAPAGVAAAALGVAAAREGGAVTHTGSLRPPASLAAVVDGVVGLDDRAVFHHSTPVPRPVGTLGFQELRDAYGPDQAAVGTGTTVATIQFSGWTASDLTDYATASGLPQPAAPTAVPSPRAYNAQTDGDGDFEVALDQESLLATAPAAEQRMYFADNSAVGFEQALTNVLTDLTNGVSITALSISWGACEQDLTAGDLDQLETRLADLTAAGVTVFAASGDSGAYDCQAGLADGSPNPAADDLAVDFPGSSPAAVSVGGTRLVHATSGWRETAWGPTWPSPGRHEGSGGGFSTAFQRPAWQVGIGGQFTTTSRAVPDIASAADPSAGFGVYEKRLCGPAGWCLGGGTSAGAPAQAGLFVASLAAAGRTDGIGDVHPVLYGNAGAFRDIRSGSNGTYSAGFGWDPVTGLGAPQWGGLAPKLLAPALVAPFAVRTPNVPVDLSVPTGTAVSTWATGHDSPPVAGSECNGGSATKPATIPLTAGADRVASVYFGAKTADASCLTASANVVLDTAAPTSAASLALANGQDARVSIGWRVVSDGPAPSWAGRFDLQITRYRDGAIVWSGQRAVTGTQTILLPQGAGYRLEVRATDRAGNTGAWAVSPYRTVPYDGVHFSYGPGWAHLAASKAFGKRIAETAHGGSWTSARFTGSTLWLMAYRTPGSGTVYVNVDGTYVGKLDLYSPTYGWRALLKAWHGPSGQHVVKFTATGRHDAAARDAKVWVDAIVVR